MRTWCVGGRAAPPRGGGSLAVCLLRPQVRRRRGTQSCSPWHRLLLGARGELLRKTFHKLCYFTLCAAKRIPTKTHIFCITCLLSCPPHPTTTHRDQNTNHNKDMDVNIKGFDTNEHVVEVGADDTVEGLRRKVASAMGLPEDGFCMSFGDEVMGAGADMTQLSAGDTIILTKKTKQEAIAELRALGETDLTAERLAQVEDPVVACLLLQAEVATAIPDGFFMESALTRLDLSAESIVTHIGDSFLFNCASLTSVDVSGLSNVTQVGTFFLCNCTSLTTLDLSPLSNVTQVGAQFLAQCFNLTTLNLSPLSNVTQIQDYFLCGCKSLTNVDLSPLSNVKLIGSWFLACCEALTTLDLSPLSRITNIRVGFGGKGFAEGCTSLTSIYLSGCSSVVSNEVRKGELKHLVVEARPKRNRDESPEESQKRLRHAQ